LRVSNRESVATRPTSDPPIAAPKRA
jgi:hypothetical protein